MTKKETENEETFRENEEDRTLVKMCGDKRANNNQANRLELSASEISARKNVVLNLFFFRL